MKLDQDEKRTRLESDNGVAASRARSRRNFLQKSSAAVVITSLAAQPVWGRCTVSGAMSGGSATHGEDDDPCVVPYVSGISPTFWAFNNDQDAAILVGAFSQVTDKDALRCFIAQVQAESFYTLPSTPTSSSETIRVGEALATSGGIHFQLAGIWLNAFFGFFEGGVLPGRDAGSPQEWVEHFFSLSLAGDEWGDAIFDAVYPGDAQTQWSNLPDGYACA